MRWQLVRHLERHFASQGDVKSGFLSVLGGLVSEMKQPKYIYILWAVIRRSFDYRLYMSTIWPDGGRIQVKKHRLFETKEEAELR